MYACSPNWAADWISAKNLNACLSQLKNRIQPSPWGADTTNLNYGLHFTGGEPFMNFDLLVTAVAKADAMQIPSMFVETNCFWCRDNEATREKLELLRKSGLVGILISVNPFYAEYIPFERTARGVLISREIFGDNVVVYQWEYFRQVLRLGIKHRIALDDYMQLTRRENISQQVELFLTGRGAVRLRAFYPRYPAHFFYRERCRPPFLRNWHNHFDNYGNILPGYCGGISLGHWNDLDELFTEGIDIKRYPVLDYLIKEDIEGLSRFAGNFGFRESPEGYVSKCDLCLDIRQCLVSRGEFLELCPREFYRHL